MSVVRRGQTWEYRSAPDSVLVVLTLRPPKRGYYEWGCLVLLASRLSSGAVLSFAVNNCDWWKRIA